MTPQNLNKNEAGNILIYILGAIFLLGILVVVVKGSSTPGSNIDRESLLIRVAEVQAYGQELERAVAYVMRNGHSEADIRFAHPDADPAYGDITDTPTRQVFAREGGGARYREPPSDIQTTPTPTDWIFTAENVVGNIGTSCTDDSCVDLTALLMNVSKGFCIELNKKASVENPSEDPPKDENLLAYGTAFTGTYQRVNHILDAAGTTLLQNIEGCFEGGGNPPAGTYHYYRVLLAR